MARKSTQLSPSLTPILGTAIPHELNRKCCQFQQLNNAKKVTYSVQILQKNPNKCPSPPFLSEWQEHILNLISKKALPFRGPPGVTKELEAHVLLEFVPLGAVLVVDAHRERSEVLHQPRLAQLHRRRKKKKRVYLGWVFFVFLTWKAFFHSEDSFF